MNIFITGSTGFIGTYVLRQFAGKADVVRALRGIETSWNYDEFPHVRWLDKPMDRIDPADLAGIDVLVHLASTGISPRKASWEQMFYWNVYSQIRLLEAAALAGVKRAVISGSFAEYGKSADRYEFIPTDAPLLPVSGYAASKAAGSVAAAAFALEHTLEIVYLRIFSVFGEGQYEQNFWPSLRKAALSGADFPMTLGEQIRDFVPVTKVAADIVEKATAELTGGDTWRVFNVGSGKPVSIRHFAEECWAAWSAKGELLFGAVPYRPNEPMRFVPLIDDGDQMPSREPAP